MATRMPSPVADARSTSDTGFHLRDDLRPGEVEGGQGFGRGRGTPGKTKHHAGEGEAHKARDSVRHDASFARTARQMIAGICGVTGSFLPAAKSVMAMVGVDCGPVRPPLANLNAQQVEEVRARLAGLGFHDFRNG